ncbi:MAG: aldehyde dehydrogenase family protein, partial [Chloroflexi bacterium]|nr:aldehyde dehydrogenase family protein [Chloroflexota bacterium]
DAAVAAARAALPAWRALPGAARARHLYALARIVQRNARLLATLESLDNGKPIRESRDIDVPLVARHFYHHAGWAQLAETELAGREPRGVCAQVIPWNFPLLMLAWKLAPALACGNTVVLKPAEHTPLGALLLAELAAEAGLPPGVFNLVTGDGRSGALLAEHPDVDKLAFTGSTEVGRQLRRATAGSGKGLTLELGGKSPFLIFEDADLDSAVEGLVDAIWLNQGEVCCAGSRLLVQESVAETLHAKLKARMGRLRVGPPLDKAVDIGAIVAPVQLARIRELCAIGEAEGAQRWQPAMALPEQGWFFPPTLFTEVAPASIIAREEIFGPVLVSMTFRSPAEAIALANDTRYGLAASVWSQDLDTALEVARRIRAGTVWVNCTNQFDAAAGFGGYQESGFGREGGREGLEAYLRPVVGPAVEDGAGPDAAGGGSDLAAGDRGIARSVDGTVELDQRGPTAAVPASPNAATPDLAAPLPPVDRTAKLYIGGRQRRPDGGYSRRVLAPDGRLLGQVGEGNRKDLRDAVEAARAASAWSTWSGHARAQVLYYLGENLAARRHDLAARIAEGLGCAPVAAAAELEAGVDACFTWAAWADKWDGAVHDTPLRALVLALNEPLGVVGLACPDASPLAALLGLAGPLLATGNRVVLLPSEAAPLVATELYQVLDTSDLPAGVLNLITGSRAELAPVLADHDDVDALWLAGDAAFDPALNGDCEARSAG